MSGVSHRAMGGTGIPKSQVSRPCREIDARGDAAPTRPIEGEWLVLCVDAPCRKLRQGERMGSFAIGVNMDSRREVPGMAIGASGRWPSAFHNLVRRGLSGVNLVVSDAHERTNAATARGLSTTPQRCRVHFQRHAPAHAGRSRGLVATAFARPDQAAAEWRRVTDRMRPGLPKPAALMEGAEDDVLACGSFPAPHRARLHSANPIERLTAEITRRTDTVGILPNEAALRRLVGAILMEWAVQRPRHMTPETLASRRG